MEEWKSKQSTAMNLEMAKKTVGELVHYWEIVTSNLWLYTLLQYVQGAALN